MAIFSPDFTVETVNKCKDLKITDISPIPALLILSNFISRIVTITNTLGVVTTYVFNISNLTNDVLLLSNYSLDKDYYLNVKMSYIFNNESVSNDTKDINKNCISTCNALIGRSNLLDSITYECTEQYNCNISTLSKIDTSIENSNYAAIYGLGEISQAFLDQSLNLIKIFKSDCNC
jgi:hypothetical protein